MPFFKRRRFVSVIGRKSAVPDGLWLKCTGCKKVVIRNEVEENLQVCPSCNFHFPIKARTRIERLVDPDSFSETHARVATLDPLGFTVGEITYLEKVERAHKTHNMYDAAITGFARIEDNPTVLGVMDFSFMGGSMGSAMGEKFCRAARDAIRERIPFIMFSASGGARMQEGVLSLMQMAKTAEAVRALNEAAVLYISVLTNPTTGGVYASFSSLGDIILAEPGAHIGFAGPRLIQGALKVELPEGFQKAEYQFANGFVDRIVSRTEMRSMLSRLLRYLSPAAKRG